MEINLNYPKEKLITLYQNIFSSLPIGIIIYDEIGQCYFANSKAVDLTGAKSIDDIMRQNYHNIESWKKTGLYDIALNTIQTSTTAHFINEENDPFESKIWLDIILNPVVVDNKKHLILIISDITEIKNKEILYKNLASLDPLTGINNRRFFEERLVDELYRCSRANRSLSLILVDIDYFKQYNDYYGHIAGDACLISVAQCIKQTLKRKTDCVARYGGEEFICLLPYTDKVGAFKAAINIKNAIEDLKIPHEKSYISKYITVSQGINTIEPSKVPDIKLCIDRVDKAMYMAKNNGRNSIKIYESI